MLDEERLTQILINVLWSIVKRVNEGSIHIRVKIKELFIIFRLVDTGDLISPSLENILNEEASNLQEENNTENIRLIMSKLILQKWEANSN